MCRFHVRKRLCLSDYSHAALCLPLFPMGKCDFPLSYQRQPTFRMNRWFTVSLLSFSSAKRSMCQHKQLQYSYLLWKYVGWDAKYTVYLNSEKRSHPCIWLAMCVQCPKLRQQQIAFFSLKKPIDFPLKKESSLISHCIWLRLPLIWESYVFASITRAKTQCGFHLHTD